MKDLFVICHNIRSLHNVGSIFRTAEGVGATKIYLCGYTGSPPRREISKVALGAEDLIPWEHHAHTWRLIARLKNEGIKIVALEQSPHSIDYQKFTPRFPLALLLGTEIKGLSKEILKRTDATIEIPMYGQKESLNVSVAAGIALYELIKNRT